MTHTPGSWRVVRYETRTGIMKTIISSNKNNVCSMDVAGRVDGPIHMDANLIAAAPDLLEALKGLKPFLTTEAEMLDYASLNEGRAGEFDVASMKAHAAIAKAEGRAE